MKAFPWLLLLSLAACDTPPVPEASAPTTSADASVAKDAAVEDGVTCSAVSGETRIEAHFAYASMKGPLSIDGKETRRFEVTAVPYAATYSFVFNGYGTGDKAPAGEKLVAGKSVVARYVSDSSAGDGLYFDMDVHPAGIASATPVRCKK